jgi:hypothetical protein
MPLTIDIERKRKVLMLYEIIEHRVNQRKSAETSLSNIFRWHNADTKTIEKWYAVFFETKENTK